MLKKVFKSPWFISAAIAVVTLIVFCRVLSADFVMWDDDAIIYRNSNIQGLSLERLAKMFTDVDSMMRYNPLTLLGWSITYHFCKAKPFWYHLVNWLLHGLNASLVFLVLRKLLTLAFANHKIRVDPWRITVSAAPAALLWSLHPLRVEPVAWCTDRTYCQALFFLLLALFFYLRAGEIEGRRHYLLLTVSIVLYIISLLSYAIGMTFFLVLLVMDIYPLGKLGGINGWWKTPTARCAIWEKIPFAAAAGAIALITVCIRIASAGIWGKPVSLSMFGLFDRFMQAMYIWAYYIWRPWYPFNLSPVYTTLVVFKPLAPVFVTSAVLVFGMIAILILFCRRWPLGLALGACHLVLLVPVLGIFEHPHYPCDRYSLIVSILWSVLLAACLASPKTKTLLSNIVLVLSVITIAGLGILTFRQTHIWNNSITLFEHTLHTLGNDPYSYDIHFRLGMFLAQQGQINEAIKHLEKTIEIDPNVPMAVYYVLGVTYTKQYRLTDAIKAFKQTVKIEPDYAKAHYNLGVVFLQTGKRSSALEQYEILKKLDPDMANALLSKITGKD